MIDKTVRNGLRDLRQLLDRIEGRLQANGRPAPAGLGLAKLAVALDQSSRKLQKLAAQLAGGGESPA